MLVSNKIVQILSVRSPIRTITEVTSPLEPWVDLSTNIKLDLPIEILHSAHTNADFVNYLSNNYPDHVYIYTDGSKLDTGSTSAALFIPELKKACSWLLGPHRSVVASELFAIWKSIQYVNSKITFAGKCILILSDSRSALQMIETKHKPSYKHIVYNIQKEILVSHANIVRFQWVKSHCGIKYNDVVDLLAKQAHDSDRTVHSKLEQEEIMKTVNAAFNKYWAQYWKTRVLFTQTGSF